MKPPLCSQPTHVCVCCFYFSRYFEWKGFALWKRGWLKAVVITPLFHGSEADRVGRGAVGWCKDQIKCFRFLFLTELLLDAELRLTATHMIPLWAQGSKVWR